MRVFSAKVHDGSLVTDEAIDLPEGAVVTVMAGENEGAFAVSRDDEDRLLAARDEAERGEVVSAEDLLARLRR